MTQTLAHPVLLKQHTQLAHLQQRSYFLRAALSHLKYVRAAQHAPVTELIALPATQRRLGRSTGRGPVQLTLSRGLVAVIRGDADTLLSTLELGLTGLNARQAWDSAAYTLLRTQTDHARTKFVVRNASFALGVKAPRGFEVSSKHVPAAAWIAHPKTFHTLHCHFLNVLSPERELVYLSRDNRELFVLDSLPGTVQDLFPRATVATYCLGFPLLHNPPAV